MIFEAEVKESIQRTRDVLSIRFTKPEKFEFKPGQFIFVTVGRSDNELTKHLSISSSPTESFLEVTKRLTGHPFANALASLKKEVKQRQRTSLQGDGSSKARSTQNGTWSHLRISHPLRTILRGPNQHQ